MINYSYFDSNLKQLRQLYFDRTKGIFEVQAKLYVCVNTLSKKFENLKTPPKKKIQKKMTLKNLSFIGLI